MQFPMKFNAMDKYFFNNRIENIKEVAGMIQRLVPNARVGIGHGQMEGKKLEELMLAFMNGEFDVLVATTIIESGLMFLMPIRFS
jgi:transcription-repair coupling factor (superfamily II helicase)